METEEADLKLKEFEEELGRKQEYIKNLPSVRIWTPFGSTSTAMAEFFAKHDIGFGKALLWFFIGIALLMVIVFINYFYL